MKKAKRAVRPLIKGGKKGNVNKRINEIGEKNIRKIGASIYKKLDNARTRAKERVLGRVFL